MVNDGLARSIAAIAQLPALSSDSKSRGAPDSMRRGGSNTTSADVTDAAQGAVAGKDYRTFSTSRRSARDTRRLVCYIAGDLGPGAVA
jgi:hypothetical protein